jgi:eukaryotic-like serine/threonine-protein kinase
VEREPAGDRPPETLGDFRLRGVLGEGGSGTVYDAMWGHRRVALKVLRRELLKTDREQERFLAEASLLQSVDHPGVVKVLGSGSLPDGRPYLAMEHLDGEPLAARVARGALPLPEALALFDQLASAVHALHLRGLVHRDIKPENIILTGAYAVLLDFGIAKAENAPASTITQEGSIRGTPAYMAPERFFGAAASPATDVYELAVVFYAMVTGRLPWSHAADPSARLNPPPPSALGHPLPPPLESVLLQALSTRAEARPPSIAELARAMHAAAGGTLAPRHTLDLPPLPPAPDATVPAAAPRSRRRRLIALAAALTALAALAVVLIVVMPGDGGEQTEPPAPAAAPAAAATTPAAPATVTLIEPSPLWPHGPGRARWLDAALDLHPADSIVLVGLSVPALQSSKVVAAALEGEKEGEVGRALTVLNAACGFDVLASIDGILLGAASDKDVQLDVTVRGRFTRSQVEGCVSSLFADDDAGPVTRKGKVSKLVSDKQTVWMGWPDEHTVFITTRKAAGEAWMKERLRRTDNVRTVTALTGLLDEVDTSAALWAVAAPRDPGESPLPGTKPPRAMYGSLLVATDLRVHAGLRYDAQADAEEMARALASRLDGFKREPLAAMWLKDAGFGVRGNDTVFTASMDHTMAVITIKGLLEQAKALK